MSKLMRLVLLFTALAMIMSGLAGCGGDSDEPEAGSGDKIKVGLSFSDFATERWKPEEVLMRGLLEDLGYEVLSQEANHDVKLQNDQIDNMVSQGAKALIIIAEDGDAIVTAVDKAADAGVIVVAYDRLIKSPKIAAYLSFNNVEVGRQQGLGVMNALDAENWDVDANGPARVVKLGGSPTDNNAILFRQGQDEIVDPYVEAGKIEIVADQWVDNWDAANALKIMENILTAARERHRRRGGLQRRHGAGRAAGDEGPGSGGRGAHLGPGRHRRWLQQHRQGRADRQHPQGHPRPVAAGRRMTDKLIKGEAVEAWRTIPWPS